MHGLAVTVRNTIREFELLRPGETVVAAVSGGLDSMALLHLLRQISPAEKWRVIVAHYHHGLRGPAADEDEEFARNAAARLGLEFRSGKGDVNGAAAARKISVEMAGRELRHQFLAEVARAAGAAAAALAHQLNDQSELFFLRLLRGAGSDGLAGMRWKSASPADPALRLVRPLLRTSRAELAKFAAAEKIDYREDASNALLDHDRNRIRHELLPWLRRAFQPALDQAISRLMEMLRDESDFLRQAAWAQAERGENFEQWPAALQRCWICGQLGRLGVDPNFELIERLRKTPGKTAIAPGNTPLKRRADGGVERCQRESRAFCRQERALALDGRQGRVEFGRLRIQWSKAPAAICRRTPGLETAECFDAAKVGRRLRLRHWQPADRMKPIGMRQAVKLQDLFTNLKIPASERRARVVAVAECGAIFWVEGLRIGEDFKIDAGTTDCLKWEWRAAPRRF